MSRCTEFGSCTQKVFLPKTTSVKVAQAVKSTGCQSALQSHKHKCNSFDVIHNSLSKCACVTHSVWREGKDCREDHCAGVTFLCPFASKSHVKEGQLAEALEAAQIQIRGGHVRCVVRQVAAHNFQVCDALRHTAELILA